MIDTFNRWVPQGLTNYSTRAEGARSDDNKGNKQWHVTISAIFAGAVGGYVCFPFEGLKKKMQSGQVITRKDFHPRELFRGAVPFAGSVTVATASSMTFRHLIHNWAGKDHSDSKAWGAASAICAGVLGAVFGSTPVENIILTQQLNKVNPLRAIQMLFSQSVTRPWVGLSMLSAREAGFACVMLWGGEAARETVYEKTNNHLYAGAAEIGVSILGATITHPFDTIATNMQHNNGQVGIKQAIANINQMYGNLGVFRGLDKRVFLFTGCALIIPRVEKEIRNAIQEIDQ